MKTTEIIIVILGLFLGGGMSCANSQDSWGAVMKQDVDGDRQLETFQFDLKKTKDTYTASLTIGTAQKEILWEHEWRMKPNDLKTMMSEDGQETIKAWVSRFFENQVFGHQKFERTKLKPDDLIDEFIEYHSKNHPLSSAQIKQDILAQKINTTFFYRAEWREDLIALVYAPKLKQFIQYTGYGR